VPKALIQPAGGQAARRHFANTIERPVPLEDLRQSLSANDVAELERIYPEEQVPTWGITPGKGDVNVSTWQQVEPGDVSLFVGGGQVFASGLITFKTTSVELAEALWGTDEEGQTWQYLYFLDRIQRHAMSYAEFNQAAGYKQGFIPRGAIVLKEPRSTSVLQLIRPDLLGRSEQEPAQDQVAVDDQPVVEPAEQAPREYAAEPAIISDYWTVGDQLGYASYAEAIAEFIQHEDTRPPLTIGIKAPWGAGKTSLMRMVQDRLDPPRDPPPGASPGQRRRRQPLTLVPQSFVANRSGRWMLLAPLRWFLSARGSRPRSGEGLGPVTNRTILQELQIQGQPHSESEPGQAGQVPAGLEASEDQLKATPAGTADAGDDHSDWRPTVWFNPWMYQSGEQVWAGFAHEVISQITGRMSRADRERFWLRLNLRRVNPDAIRRRMHRALFERLIPLVGGVAVVVLVVLAAVALRTFLPGVARFLNVVAGLVAAGGSLGIVGVGVLKVRAFFGEQAAGSLASLVREPDYVAGWKKLLADEARGSYGELVADPGYEGRLGFLYLVQTDMQRVLDLVATEQQPVVVFVDDLDRCSPSTVAQVIEAINLFLAGQFPNCIFVIAMEPEMVAAHIEVAYQALGERLRTSDYWGEAGMLGWRFLDKIVQLPLSLPVLDPERASRFTGSVLVGGSQSLEPDEADDGDAAEERAAQLEQAIRQEATSIEDIPEAAARVQAKVLGADVPAGTLSPEAQAAARRALRQRLRDDDPEVRAIVEAVAPWLNRNPREIKRFVNVFRFYVLIRQGRQEAGLPVPDSLEQVAKLAVLAVRWPQLRGILGRQIGPEDGDTLLALLEAPLEELPADAAWSERKEALAKKLAGSPVPEKLRQDLLAHEALCECLANGPPIGAAASGFL
jgi:KAP family P-loop domain